jgi:hypothetical protein
VICLQGGDRVNDWLWSVGDSPLSDTSTAAHFSGIQRDLVHRNAIASAIEETLNTLQISIDIVASLPNTSALSRNFMWSYIRLGYPKLVKNIRTATTKVKQQSTLVGLFMLTYCVHFIYN